MNQLKIHSSVLLLQDVAAVLRALYDVQAQALRNTVPDDYQAGYQAGFAAAIRAAATAFHVDASFVSELAAVVTADFRVVSSERNTPPSIKTDSVAEVSAPYIVGHLR